MQTVVFVAPAGFEPATSPPKGDVLPLHHGALDSFVPVVLAAHVIAASEPVPVCCASAIRRRGAVSSSLAHDPPIWVLSAYPILFLPLRTGVILPEYQTPRLCGWLSLWCRQDSNLHGCFPRSVIRNLRCPTTISPSFCVRLPFRHYTICRSFPAVVLLRASRRTVRNHHTDCLCALEARKPLPSPEAAKHPSLKNTNHEHHRLRTLSFQSCPVDLLGFQERFDFEPAEQYRRVFSRSGLYSPDILPLDMIVEPVVGIALVQFPTCHHVRLRSITTAHGQSHEIGRFDQRILYISDVHRSINLQSKILLHSFYPAAPAGR